MPDQVTTTRGANLHALVQKSQARALPRTPQAGQAAQAGQQPGAERAQGAAPAQDFRAMLQRIEAARQERARGIAS